MISITDGSVKIQTTSESNFSTPSWFGEVVLIVDIFASTASWARSARGALCTTALRALRGDRLSCGPLRLCRKRRAHPGGVLRAAPAICGPIHGLV